MRAGVQERGELSAKVVVVSGSSGVPKHDSSEDVRVLGVHGRRDGLQSGSVDVARSGGIRRGRSTDDDLHVRVGRARLSPRSPGGKVELTRISVEAAVVVVELDPNVVEPAVGESETRLGAEPVVRVRALRSARDVVGLRGADEVSSELVDKVSIAGRGARFDVEIDSVEGGSSKRSNGSTSSEESVPDEIGESLSLRSRSETISAFSTTKREEDLLSLALAVFDVRSDVRASEQVLVAWVRVVTVSGEVQGRIGRISRRSREVIDETNNDDIVS